MTFFLGRAAGREWAESRLAEQLKECHTLMDQLECEGKPLLESEDALG